MRYPPYPHGGCGYGYGYAKVRPTPTPTWYPYPCSCLVTDVHISHCHTVPLFNRSHRHQPSSLHSPFVTPHHALRFAVAVRNPDQKRNWVTKASKLFTEYRLGVLSKSVTSLSHSGEVCHISGENLSHICHTLGSLSTLAKLEP